MCQKQGCARLQQSEGAGVCMALDRSLCLGTCSRDNVAARVQQSGLLQLRVGDLRVALDRPLSLGTCSGAFDDQVMRNNGPSPQDGTPRRNSNLASASPADNWSPCQSGDLACLLKMFSALLKLPHVRRKTPGHIIYHSMSSTKAGDISNLLFPFSRPPSAHERLLRHVITGLLRAH